MEDHEDKIKQEQNNTIESDALSNPVKDATGDAVASPQFILYKKFLSNFKNMYQESGYSDDLIQKARVMSQL